MLGGETCCNKTLEAVGRTHFLQSRRLSRQREYLEERVAGTLLEVLYEGVIRVRSIDEGCCPISKSYCSVSVHLL